MLGTSPETGNKDERPGVRGGWNKREDTRCEAQQHWGGRDSQGKASKEGRRRDEDRAATPGERLVSQGGDR